MPFLVPIASNATSSQVFRILKAPILAVQLSSQGGSWGSMLFLNVNALCDAAWMEPRISLLDFGAMLALRPRALTVLFVAACFAFVLTHR